MKSPGTLRFRADSEGMINTALRYWKLLLITGIAAFTLSVVVSLNLKPLYRSAAVLYPTTNVVEIQTLFGVQNTSSPLFGDETATEKVLQILKSDMIKQYLVSRYDLINHYGISPDAKYRYTMLDARMKKNIISRKTQYNSVEISVLDTDPELAAEMANDIAAQIDTVFNMIVRDAGRKSLQAIKNSYEVQYSRVRSLEDSLVTLSGGKSVSAIPANMKAGARNSDWASAAGRYDPEFLRLINMFESENENLSAIQSRLTEAKMLAEQILPYIHMINTAKVSEKKALPKRSVIVIASTISTLLFVFFILALSGMIVREKMTTGSPSRGQEG